MLKTQIIVVGAGIAGIAAARTLHDEGYVVTVLEARDRIGGRIHTDYSLGLPVELGATWIHGIMANPLTSLAQAYGLSYVETDFINRSGCALQAYDADGTPLDMDEYTEGQFMAKGACIQAFASILVNRPNYQHRSHKYFVQNDLPKYADMTATQQKGFYYWSTILEEYLNASDWDIMDWQIRENFVSLPGGDWLLPDGGYGEMIKQLSDGLDIRTEVEVETVDYSQASVRVITKEAEMLCKQVIMTAPLGVLKAGAIEFEPILPKEKQAAIARMGAGSYEKLVMRFDKFYWPEDKQRFNYISDTHNEGTSLFNAWFNAGYYSKKPVLVVYHAGRRACLTNEWSDEEFLERTRAMMQRLFGDNGYGDIPAPISYVRSQWQNDPFSQGAISSDQIGQHPDDRHTFAKAVNKRLFFAGEASHPHFYTTAHGAYETGVRAAREIIELKSDRIGLKQ